MRICPQCRTAYPDRGLSTCTRDGVRLVDARDFAEAQADPLLGKVIGDRYRIIERVGVGGMGTVYRASQSGLDRQVAIKILKRDLSWDSDTVTRFHREARAMSLLTHPNTVRVFDFGETPDGLLYFTMELLEGELLTSRVEREGPVDVHASIRIVQQILRSLSEAHTKGIIHRDLKPDNIYLAQVEGHAEPVVKVLDFGIAKIVQGERAIDQLETQAGTVFGTPRYMSPEQAQGKKLDPRSDLYSVGILLYQLLTGRAPFVDDDAVVVMAKHIRERPMPPREITPDQPIPVALDRVVMRAIEKDPARRFKTAERFITKLELCVADIDREIAARRSRFGAFRRWMAQAPRAPLAAGAGILTAAVILAVYLVGRADPVPPADPVAALPSSAVRASPPTAQSLVVQSEPEGAEVWSGGELLGRTPLTVMRPDGSELPVELRMDGFEPARTDLVANGQPHVVLLHAGAAPAEALAFDDPAADERTEQASDVAPTRRARRRAQQRRAERARRTQAGQEPTEPPMDTSMATDEPYERW